MVRKITVPYDRDSFLGRWIDGHRTVPWFGAVPWRANATTRAGALYEAYRADAEDDDRAVASERDFGLTLQSAGFDPQRDENGRYYENIGTQTRAQRALHQAREEVMRPIIDRHHHEARLRHFEQVSHSTTSREVRDGRLVEQEVDIPCEHKGLRDFMGLPVGVDVWIVEGDETAAEEIKARANEVEANAGALVAEWYQPLVDWRPGEPDPTARLVARRRVPEDRTRLAELEAEIAAKRPRLEGLEAALPSYKAYIEEEKQRTAAAMRKAGRDPNNLIDVMTWGIRQRHEETEKVLGPERVDEYEISSLRSALARLTDEASMLRPRIERDEAILQG